MNTASRRRLLVLYAVAAAMLISLGGRLWYLQVMNNTAFTKLAAAGKAAAAQGATAEAAAGQAAAGAAAAEGAAAHGRAAQRISLK